MKELSDNAYDWLNAYYPPAKNKKKPGRIIKRFVKLEYEHGLLWMVTTTGTGLYI